MKWIAVRVGRRKGRLEMRSNRALVRELNNLGGTWNVSVEHTDGTVRELTQVRLPSPAKVRRNRTSHRGKERREGWIFPTGRINETVEVVVQWRRGEYRVLVVDVVGDCRAREKVARAVPGKTFRRARFEQIKAETLAEAERMFAA
jgi:hypothetical protein